MSRALSDRPKDDFVFVDAAWQLRQVFRRDPLRNDFFAGLRDKRLLGVRDPASGRVLFPPRFFSQESYTELAELVPVGPGGAIRTLTRLPGGRDGRPPRTIVYVQLDGADSAAAGPLLGAGSDTETPLALIGARCRALFKDEPVGDWADFWYELDAG
jgi:uncharacterized OB-fold protein